MSGNRNGRGWERERDGREWVQAWGSFHSDVCSSCLRVAFVLLESLETINIVPDLVSTGVVSPIRKAQLRTMDDSESQKDGLR